MDSQRSVPTGIDPKALMCLILGNADFITEFMLQNCVHNEGCFPRDKIIEPDVTLDSNYYVEAEELEKYKQYSKKNKYGEKYASVFNLVKDAKVISIDSIIKRGKRTVAFVSDNPEGKKIREWCLVPTEIKSELFRSVDKDIEYFDGDIHAWINSTSREIEYGYTVLLKNWKFYLRKGSKIVDISHARCIHIQPDYFTLIFRENLEEILYYEVNDPRSFETKRLPKSDKFFVKTMECYPITEEEAEIFKFGNISEIHLQSH